MPRSAIVIGSGFAGLSAATFLAKEGWIVTILEKNATPGGRARQLKEDGFTFDMGPSFYWMPNVFERYFSQFGKKITDYYSLQRLDPSYRVYWKDSYSDIPADFSALKDLFETIEPGSGARLEKYLEGAAYKYEAGMTRMVFKPGKSLMEYVDRETITGIFRLQVFSSIKKHIESYFRDSRLRQLMEFPVLFLGALPKDTPALYSLMNYADIKGGTWYPVGGMYAVVDAMVKLSKELGVQFRFSENVSSIQVENGRAVGVISNNKLFEADIIISAADYHFTEKNLLAAKYRSYSDRYWKKRVMAPSCLMYYIGLNKKLKQAVHHSLFFDVPFEKHGKEIYETFEWPSEPLFYVSVSSVTDAGAAPEGYENIVVLIPVAAGLEGDNEELREKYYNKVMDRMEERFGENIRDAVIYKKTYSVSDYVNDYNSYRGNAYGLANTLRQTGIFRPACQSKKVKGLYYTGQLTVPGPGVPPSLISGEVVAKEVIHYVESLQEISKVDFNRI